MADKSTSLPRRSSQHWFITLAEWALGVSAAWFVATMLSSLLLISFVLSEGERSSSTGPRTLFGTFPGALLGGALIGVVPAVFVGLLWQRALRQPRRAALLAAVTAVGITSVLCALSSYSAAPPQSYIARAVIVGVMCGLLGGTFAGVFTWQILLRCGLQGRGWFWATLSGWMAGWIILASTSALAREFSLRSFAVNLVGGALVGLLQWPILRHQLRLAVWWIVASALGWSIFFGMGYGVITALALVLLLRYNAPSLSESQAP